MSGKVLVSAVSLILVVGVAIGTVVVVHKQNGDSGQISSHQNAVAQMCQNTDDPKFCQQVLGHVNDTSDPKAFLTAVVEATTNSVIKAFNMSDRLSVDHGNGEKGLKMALDDCKDLLQFAMDSLQSSTDLLRNDIKTVTDQTPDFRNWLSAVISYQQACMDGFDDNNDGEKQVKSQLQEQALDGVGKITGIALDIVADLAKILDKFGLKLDLKPASRRLMEVDSEGYPTWFSASDRKLLQKMHRGHHVKPNVVVAKDGSGNFKTIAEAIASYPKKGANGRYVIFVKAGVYQEYIIVPKNAVNILMYGEGAGKTVITGNKNFVDGVKTMQTATFANTANGFIAKYMSFVNSAGPEKHQAVALRNQGDMSAFFDCAIVGNQDTLYAQTNRQFYKNCDISGTIDFIFGVSPTLIQSSRIILRKPLDNQFNTVTADGTAQKNMPTGIVIQNCDIVPEPALFPLRFQLKSYLGRPWKAYSKTVVMESRIGDVIHPDGWIPWEGSMYLDTLYYAEYNNEGPGANVQGRVKWPGYKGLISKNEALQFTAGQFLQGGPTSNTAVWLKALHVPYDIGLTKP
ncbi:pectinesterase-like [Neltuma alba]|uniref:pectinesterase-like n=1 Tax=Neltuma alba TaxID=207710 RepID=UPI0010A4E92F|nr:pectinesterase-like [Prosopis alba]